MQTIFKRRSIRKYKQDSVSQENINKLIKAAQAAPSARNYKPAEYIVVTDREYLDKITTVHPYANMLKQAPLAIIVCGDTKKQPIEGYIAQDCSAAIQNILLEATNLELGSCWLGVWPNDDRIEPLRELFNIPPNIVPFSIIALGYPDEVKDSNNNFDENVIHYNFW